MRALELLTLLLMSSCAGGQESTDLIHLRFRPDVPDSVVELVERSPIILLGKVQRVEDEGGPRTVNQGRGFLVKQRHVAILAERCFRGCVAGEEVVFSYVEYLNSPDGYTGPPLLRLARGDLRIVFLEPIGAKRRSVCDIVDCTIRGVRSGGDLPTSTSRLVSEEIAEVLMTPPAGLEPAEFIAELGQRVALVSSLTSRRFAMTLLQRLISRHSDDVAAAACARLAELYSGQGECMKKFATSHYYPSEEVRRAINAREATVPARLEEFRKSGMAKLSQAQLRFECSELGLLQFHQEPGIRQAAGELVFRYCLDAGAFRGMPY